MDFPSRGSKNERKKRMKMLARNKLKDDKFKKKEGIVKMKTEDPDEYSRKKQIEVLQESRMMIPDCQRRLEAARADLRVLDK
uniref:Tubulin-specific chaperone A n=1 Tax=Anolis carolinensis TaxID=28377 RepID=A0A803TSE2_ANOCA